MTKRILIVQDSTTNSNLTRQIYIPNTVKKYKFKAVAGGGCGGGNGGSAANKSGGGGGAGDYVDFEIELHPKSIVSIVFTAVSQSVGYPKDITIFYKPLNSNYVEQILKCGYAGSEGNSTTPGKGGDSGGGGEGGTYNATADPNNFPTGFVDTDSKLHTSGGSSGFGIGAVNNLFLNYGYQNQGGTTKNQRAKAKFGNDDCFWTASRGGIGGCSYFGGGGNVPGFGGGGNGLAAGVGVTGGSRGGPAFFMLEWD